MIIGFSRHSGLGGSGPVLSYLTGYLVNGEARDPKPEVVRGDTKAVAEIIDALPFKRRYSSGVLSFSAEDNVTPEIQEDIMNRFERAAFAGIPSDRRSIVWIKHRDKGRTELHFVVPRVDLGTGKSLNIAPPTPASRLLFDTLRSSINTRYGFRDPTDPANAQDFSVPSHVAKLAAQAKRLGRSAKNDIRRTITDHLLKQARAGLIKNRAGVLQNLMGHGFKITRAGIDYITIVSPENGERVRLKGNIYREQFRLADLTPAPRRGHPAKLHMLDRSLEQMVENRSTFHRARYALNEPRPEIIPVTETHQYDRIGNTSSENRPAIGTNAAGARATIWGDALRLNEAAQQFRDASDGFERASNSFGRADRTFAAGFEQTLTEVERTTRAASLVNQYGLRTRARTQDRGMEMELEL
ncbi:MAG: relaxase/mobilization nuclease domain-containing protein [Verrucomicrobiota bacterium]